MVTTTHHMIIFINACQKVSSPCLQKFTKKKQSETPATGIGRRKTRRAQRAETGRCRRQTRFVNVVRKAITSGVTKMSLLSQSECTV